MQHIQWKRLILIKLRKIQSLALQYSSNGPDIYAKEFFNLFYEAVMMDLNNLLKVLKVLM